jgi:hypothetical protein
VKAVSTNTSRKKGDMVGSVQDFAKCPQCEFEGMMTDYQTRSGDYHKFCNRCGYVSQEETIWSPDNTQAIAMTFMEEKDNIGTYAIKDRRAIATQVGTYKDKELVIEWMLSHKDICDTMCYTEKRDGIWVLVDLIDGNIIPLNNITGEDNFQIPHPRHEAKQ